MCLLKTCCWVCYVQHIIQVVISTYISQKFQEILLRAQCKIKYFFLQAFHLGQVAGAAAGMVSCMYVHIGAKALVNVNQCTCMKLLCNVVSQRMYVYVLAPQMLWPVTCTYVSWHIPYFRKFSSSRNFRTRASIRKLQIRLYDNCSLLSCMEEPFQQQPSIFSIQQGFSTSLTIDRSLTVCRCALIPDECKNILDENNYN